MIFRPRVSGTANAKPPGDWSESPLSDGLDPLKLWQTMRDPARISNSELSTAGDRYTAVLQPVFFNIHYLFLSVVFEAVHPR